MHGPRKGRSLAEIVEDALAIIDPPIKAREQCRARIADRIRRERDRPVPWQRRKDMLERFDDYRKQLRKARRAAAAVNLKSSADAIDAEITKVEIMIAQIRRLPPQKGSRLLDVF